MVIIDTPPSLGLLTVNALTCADTVVVPVSPDGYSLQGFHQLTESIRTINIGMSRKGKKMALFDARTHDFEEVEIFEKPALFTCLRIDSRTVPNGIYKYEVRHDDDMQGIACQLGRRIVVNHWGTLLTREPIELDKDGFKNLTEEDLNYATGDCRTLKQYGYARVSTVTQGRDGNSLEDQVSALEKYGCQEIITERKLQ